MDPATDINMETFDFLSLTQEILNDELASDNFNSDYLEQYNSDIILEDPYFFGSDQGSENDDEFFPGESFSDCTLSPTESQFDASETHSPKDISPATLNILRNKIQERRLNQGKAELTHEDLNWESTHDRRPLSDLTEEERLKETDRRKKNRLAAQKCRDKKKDEAMTIAKKLKAAVLENRRLKRCLSEVKRKNDLLATLEKNHSNGCSCINRSIQQLES